MTPRLCLVRHAEAAATAAGGDLQRPLTARGEADATEAGRWLAGAGLVPGAAVVSPALRTRQTWGLLAAALPDAPEPRIDRRLHGGTLDDYLEVVRETAEDVAVLVVVGHNPSVAALAAELLSGPAPGFPPAGRAVLDLAVGWADAAPGSAVLAASAAP